AVIGRRLADKLGDAEVGGADGVVIRRFGVVECHYGGAVAGLENGGFHPCQRVGDIERASRHTRLDDAERLRVGVKLEAGVLWWPQQSGRQRLEEPGEDVHIQTDVIGVAAAVKLDQ